MPRLIYAYMSAPISAIVARMPIISYSSLLTQEAIKLAGRGCIDYGELQDYAKGMKELLVMEIGQVAVARNPITCTFMSANFNFWPSSTFIPLSASGARNLDELGQFENVMKDINRK